MDIIERHASDPQAIQTLSATRRDASANFLAGIVSAWKIGLLLVLSLAVLFFVKGTWHWPLVGDAPLLHYVVFLAQHGRIPYRDILDPNMPGAYFVEWIVIHFFGPGALAWRLFDFGLLAAAAACMFAICRPHGWFAGAFAAGIFALIHGRDGLADLGQRDLVMSVLLLAACACLFSNLRLSRSRRREFALALASGFFFAFAASIKPTALLFAVPFLILSTIALRRRDRPVARHVAAALTGFAIPGIAILVYLVRAQALSASSASISTTRNFGKNPGRGSHSRSSPRSCCRWFCCGCRLRGCGKVGRASREPSFTAVCLQERFRSSSS